MCRAELYNFSCWVGLEIANGQASLPQMEGLNIYNKLGRKPEPGAYGYWDIFVGPTLHFTLRLCVCIYFSQIPSR